MSDERSTPSEAEMRGHIQLVSMAATAIDHVPFDDLLRAFEQADAFGHFFDPTAYRRSQKDREAIVPVLRAGREFVAAVAAARAALPAVVAHRAACEQMERGGL